MQNIIVAIKMLKDAGYRAVSVQDHTVIAIDTVQCTSGQRKWVEEREVPMNITKNLNGVAAFISDRS